MKRILLAIAVAAACATPFTGCKNQPSFVKLAAAVDSTEMALQSEPATWCESSAVQYDEVTNAVKYTFVLPGKLDKEQFEAGAATFEDLFVAQNFVLSDRYDLGKEIVDAKANVLVEIRGAEGGEFEILIENAKIAEAYNAAHADSDAE